MSNNGESIEALKAQLEEQKHQIEKLTVALRKKDLQLVEMISPSDSREVDRLRKDLEKNNETIADLKEEMTLSKTEFQSIVHSLISEVKAKSDELTRAKSVLEGTSNYIRDSKRIESEKHTSQSDEIKHLKKLNEELMDNLKHARNQNKLLTSQIYSMKSELKLFKDSGLGFYQKQISPFLGVLSETDYNTSVFSTNLVDLSHPAPQVPVPKSPTPPLANVAPRSYRSHYSKPTNSEVKVVVYLPNGGSYRCSFDGSQAIEVLKLDVFNKKLKDLEPSQYCLAFSKSQIFDNEQKRLLDCHPSIPISQTPIELYLYHLPSNQIAQRNFRSGESIFSSPVAMPPTIARSNSDASQLKPTIFTNPQITGSPFPFTPNNTNNLSNHSNNGGNDGVMMVGRSVQSSQGNYPRNWGRKQPAPNNFAQSPKGNKMEQAGYMPIAFLSPSLSQPFIIFVHRTSKASEIFQSVTTQLRDLLQRLDVKQQIYSIVGAEKNILTINGDDVISNLPFVVACRRQQKIPVFSIGEASIINPQHDTNEEVVNNSSSNTSKETLPVSETSPQQPMENGADNGQLTSSQVLINPSASSAAAEKIDINSARFSSTQNNNNNSGVQAGNKSGNAVMQSQSTISNNNNNNNGGSGSNSSSGSSLVKQNTWKDLKMSREESSREGFLKNSRRGVMVNNETDAIPVVFILPTGNTVEMNLPRKAKVDTIKKMALKRYDGNDSNSLRYYLKVTGTSYFITEGELSLEELPIVKFCQKKGLTTMLSLVTKEKSREEKIISKKIGAILSTALGGPPSAWQIMDNDASDFRIKMSRIIGDKELAYVPALPVEYQPPTDSQLPSQFRVSVHLEENDNYSIGAKTLKVDGSMMSDEVIRLICQKINTSHFLQLDPSHYILKICGIEMYFDRSVRLDSVVYIRDCLQKKRKIGFALVPKFRAPNFELCTYGTNVKNYIPIDTPTVDLYGDKDTVSLFELKNPFEIKIISVENVITRKFDLQFGLPSDPKKDLTFFVKCGVYHGGTIITTSPNDTGFLSTNAAPLINGKVVFRQWLRSPIRLCNIPEDSRVCITLYARKDGSSYPIANVNSSLFDFKDTFQTGELTLRMWTEEKEANPIGTCVENLSAPSHKTTKITIGFHSFPQRVAFPNLKPLELIDFSFPQPTKHEVKLLEELIDSDPLRKLSYDEKALLWKYREFCRCNTKPRSLVKILECVNWTDVDDVRETYRLLLSWDPVSPVDALQLLDAKFANRKVREYAVKCLDSLPDQDLKDYLLQLVQVLKYEPTHFSPVASWLLNRALHNQMMIGHAFFWHLQAELHVPEISERFALILEMYLRGCGDQRDDLLKQVELVEKLNRVANDIKSVTPSGGKRLAYLQKRLSELDLPEKFQLPLDPTKCAKGFVLNRCKSMDSAKAPLWLVFENADPFGDTIWLIFKSGDDLRQDLLTLQMLGIMDKIWKKEGLDLCLTPYKCIATGNGMGMIETVLESDTTANIQKNFGGVKPLGALMKTPLANWLKERNPGAEYDVAVENFTRSCAGYCVATYVLGIGDRHNDNIMVNKYGFLFHIDFGHFLGHKKKVLNISRERAPFVLTPEFANVMGCKGSETFQRFVDFCCKGYNTLRKHANIFINLFAMMLSTGIPELRSEDDIQYIRSSLKMELTDEEAAKHFTNLIKESLASMSTQLNFAAHIIAHWK